MKNTYWIAKFGGSSFSQLSDYPRIAEHLLAEVRATGRKVVVVVSAMPGETELLRERLAQVNAVPSYRGTAGILSLADVTSAYLLQEAVHRLGGRARMLPQCNNGIVTDRVWMSANIVELTPTPVLAALNNNDVVVIPGGPASDGTCNPTWMGKNSSDLAAVATAVNVGVHEVDIHSDVHGVYSADPNIVPEAEVLPAVSYDAAALLSSRGAKVLHRRSVILAKQHEVEIRCRGNRAPFECGTVISKAVPCITAVVIDLRSVLVGFSDQAQASRAHATLIEQGVHAVLPTDVERPLLAVPGGFIDVERHLSESGIEFRRVRGRLVSEIRGLTVITHLAEDDEEAVSIGRQLHAQRFKRLSSHHATSRLTHADRAASGEAITTNQVEVASASSMKDHRPGLAVKLVVSRIDTGLGGQIG